MRRLGTILVFLFAAFFAMLALGYAIQVDEARRVWATGKAAEGTLTQHHGRRKSTLREYSYSYRVEGRELTAERRTIPWSAREIPVGSKLDVRYDPADPGMSVTPAELQELENWANRLFLPLIATALFAWGIVRIVRKPGKEPTPT